MYDNRIKIDNVDPIRVKHEGGNLDVKIKQDGIFGDSIKMKLVGGRAWAVAVAMVLIMAELFDIHFDLKKANNLKEQEIKIRQEQLDLARRQFQLDSIAMTQNQKNR